MAKRLHICRIIYNIITHNQEIGYTMAFCIERHGLFADRSGRIAGGLAGQCRISCIMRGRAG